MFCIAEDMQVLFNLQYEIVAVDRMVYVPYVEFFFFRDLKIGGVLSCCGCSRPATPTKVGLLIYSLMRAPPCGHVDSYRKTNRKWI